MLTQDQATEQAVKMYKEGKKYEDIATALKDAGYVSQRTRRAIKGPTVRLMVEKFFKDNPNESRMLGTAPNTEEKTPSAKEEIKVEDQNHKRDSRGQFKAEGGRQGAARAGDEERMFLVKKVVGFSDVSPSDQVKLIRSILVGEVVEGG